jgi:hypothetical protein
MFDPARIKAEADFLEKYPWFIEKPASIIEFLGPEYLNIDAQVRPGLRKALIDIFGEEVNPYKISGFESAMFTGAIGIGKTTFASIALPYMCHWVLCLENPQKYFELLPGSRIAFMQMSTSEKQALAVVFGDIFARIKNSKWFIDNYPHDDKFTKQIRFPGKDIWILPGGSLETSFEGFNILGGVLDEMDSHKITDEKDYADVGYDAINSRIASRFPIFGDDGVDTGHKGLLICIGQMKSAVGFGARKFKELSANPKSYVWRQTIWESFGWQRYTNKKTGQRASFWYDMKRKKIIPSGVADLVEKVDHVIEIPETYRNQFETNPEKALRDLAGIPPATSDPFISQVDRIEECRERWIERYERDESPVRDDPHRIHFEPWFRSRDPRKRHIHIDLAYSPEGDALGMAMGYIEAVKDIEGERKPYIVFDALMRMHAAPGQEIYIQDVRRIVYELKEELGFRVYSISMDGFQSQDSMQQFRKKRYVTEYLSIDKSTLPYEDLRDAIYERRLEFPPYVTHMRLGDTDRTEIAVKELMELSYDGKKVDHPPQGSKDVADAMAGVVTTLMGDRTYRKGVTSIATSEAEEDQVLQADGTTGMGIVIPLPGHETGLKAPVPPSVGGMMGLTIPPRLQPKGKR